MNVNLRKSKLKLPIQLIAILFFISLLTTCGDSRLVTEYPLKKVDPKENQGIEWLPLNPTTYRIDNNIVISETLGLLAKYEECKALSLDNWECKYSDGSGSFGFKNGEFWRIPAFRDIKVVSRFEYNCIRCEWALKDTHEGMLWGAARCIIGWK
jgi:hypothetical protein